MMSPSDSWLSLQGLQVYPKMLQFYRVFPALSHHATDN
jgi:hypothetical protein